MTQLLDLIKKSGDWRHVKAVTGGVFVPNPGCTKHHWDYQGEWKFLPHKRTAILTKNITKMCPQLKGEKLTKICEPRLVQNPQYLICFQEMLGAIFSWLEQISESSLEGEVSSQAFSVSSSIKS